MSTSSSSSSGIGFTGLLTIVFITLKLTGVITWSWFWVLSPLFIGWAIGLLIIGVVALWLGWAAQSQKDTLLGHRQQSEARRKLIEQRRSLIK